jgi:hypothetical protein
VREEFGSHENQTKRNRLIELAPQFLNPGLSAASSKFPRQCAAAACCLVMPANYPEKHRWQMAKVDGVDGLS